MKKIILTGALTTIVFGYIFAAGHIFTALKKPKASYQELERKVRMLERQIGIMQDGWSGCLQEYENLMNDCRSACDGKI